MLVPKAGEDMGIITIIIICMGITTTFYLPPWNMLTMEVNISFISKCLGIAYICKLIIITSRFSHSSYRIVTVVIFTISYLHIVRFITTSHLHSVAV